MDRSQLVAGRPSIADGGGGGLSELVVPFALGRAKKGSAGWLTHSTCEGSAISLVSTTPIERSGGCREPPDAAVWGGSVMCCAGGIAFGESVLLDSSVAATRGEPAQTVLPLERLPARRPMVSDVILKTGVGEAHSSPSSSSSTKASSPQGRAANGLSNGKAAAVESPSR